MKSEPVEIIATILQLSVFLAIIFIMSQTMFGETIIDEIRSFAAATVGI